MKQKIFKTAAKLIAIPTGLTLLAIAMYITTDFVTTKCM